MSNDNNDDNVRISWDYTLTEEDTKGGAENDNVILPDGDYDAVIKNWTRGQFAGSESLAASPMAVLYIDIDGGDLGRGFAQSKIILNQKLAWKIDQLAISCGFWKKGEGKGKRMPWDELKGAAVRVKVSTREYKGKKYQDILRFLPPKEAPAENGEAQDAGFALPDEV